MGRTLRLLLNIHSSESVTSLFFILLGLCWSIGAYGIFTLSEGLFLEYVGAQLLPLTYVCVACCLCGLSVLMISLLRFFSIKNLLTLLILFWILLASSFVLIYPVAHGSTVYWFIFKMIGWMMPISIYICYWSFIDQYIDLQDGKRLFALFNSVTFLGDAMSSGFLSLAIKKVGIQQMVSCYAVVLALSIPMILWISKKMPILVEAHADHEKTKNQLSWREILRRILQSKFTVYLLSFYFLMQLLAIVTEFNYMSTFQTILATSGTHALTEFLATCNMWIGLANVAIGLFVYSRLVKKMGVHNLSIVAPMFFFLLFCFWFWRDGLSLAVLGLIGREGMIYTFDDNNLNLLISGVPSRVKNQVRIFVESFFEPMGMLCGASLLLLFTSCSITMGLLIAVLALFSVWFVRHNYPKAIFKNLVTNSIYFGKRPRDWIGKQEQKLFEQYLLAQFKTSDEASRLLAFEYLIELGNKNYLSRMLNQINLFSIPSKIKAIDLLANSSWSAENLVVDKLESWRRLHPHPSVRGAIHFYLARRALLRPEKVMNDLSHPHLDLRAAAILTFTTLSSPAYLPSLQALAAEELTKLLTSSSEAEIEKGLAILAHDPNAENVHRVLPFLIHSSILIQRMAAKAVASLANPNSMSLVPLLIRHLTTNRDPDVVVSILKALSRMSDTSWIKALILASVHFRPAEILMARRLILDIPGIRPEMFLEILQHRFYHERCRLLAAKILARLDPRVLKQQLPTILEMEMDRAYFYSFHLEYSVDPNYPVLGNALESSLHTILDFLVQLVGLTGAFEESEVLPTTLRSRNQKLRAQALETLHKSCPYRLFSILEPLLQTNSGEKKMQQYLKRGFIPLKLDSLLDLLVDSSRLTDQIVAVWLQAKIGLPSWRDTVRKKLQNNEDVFRHFAEELLKDTP